jgi:hypothetical protein
LRQPQRSLLRWSNDEYTRPLLKIINSASVRGRRISSASLPAGSRSWACRFIGAAR